MTGMENKHINLVVRLLLTIATVYVYYLGSYMLPILIESGICIVISAWTILTVCTLFIVQRIGDLK